MPNKASFKPRNNFDYFVFLQNKSNFKIQNQSSERMKTQTNNNQSNFMQTLDSQTVVLNFKKNEIR